MTGENITDADASLFSTGDVCVAKWSKDDVWYNAVITSVELNGSYAVMFSDYGNAATIDGSNILKNANAISKNTTEDCIDENVKMSETGVEKMSPENPSAAFSVGESCSARWDEDMVRYNGKITDVNKDGSFVVNFVDYGNTEVVRMPFIVKDGAKIPLSVLKDQIDENVQNTKSQPDELKDSGNILQTKVEISSSTFSVGDTCVARWTEDMVWYNGKITNINVDGSLMVNFIDYGNTEIVEAHFIVFKSSDIPESVTQDEIDENVVGREESKDVPAEEAKQVMAPNKTEDKITKEREKLTPGNQEEVQPDCMVLNHVELLMKGEQSIIDENVKVHVKDLVQSFEDKAKSSSPSGLCSPSKPWAVGEDCIAMWSEDNVWYNARIEEARNDGSFAVQFVDYGNSDVVCQLFIVKKVSEISQTDPILDENVVPEGKFLQFEKDLSKTDSNVVKNTGANSPSISPSSQKVKTPEADMIKSLLTPEQLRIMSGKSVITSLNLLKFVAEFPNGTRHLPVKKMIQISQDVKEPIGITILQNNNIVIASTGDDSVKIFSQSGKVITLVQSRRLFRRPSDMT